MNKIMKYRLYSLAANSFLVGVFLSLGILKNNIFLILIIPCIGIVWANGQILIQGDSYDNKNN